MSVEVKAKKYAAFSDRDIKKLLNEWSSTQKMVPTDFGDSIDISKKTSKDAFKLKLITEYETRIMEHKSAPRYDKSIVNNFTNCDIWNDIIVDYNLTKFEGEHTFRISNSVRIETCSDCGGKGNHICYRCKGKGNITCTKCGGKGEIVCEDCKGTGEMICPICDGKRIVGQDSLPMAAVKAYYKMDLRHGERCPECHGTGKRSCLSCFPFNGVEKCFDCHMTGLITCPDCGGAGIVECQNCDAIGEIVEWDNLIVKYTSDIIDKIYTEVESLNNLGMAEGEELVYKVNISKLYMKEKKILEIDGRSVSMLPADGPNHGMSDTPAIDEKIMSLIREIFISEDKHYMAMENSKRLYQALRVIYIPITEIDYIYKDKSYTFWTYGYNNSISINKAPKLIPDKIYDTTKKIKGLFKR